MIGKQLIWEQISSKSSHLAPSNPNITPTFNLFPSTTQYRDESILLGLVLKPYGPGEHLTLSDIPQVCFGHKGIIRCQICKSYMNPYNPILKSRSSYYCCICGWLNPLPVHYEVEQESVERSNLTYDIVPFNNQFNSKRISEPHVVLVIETSYEFLRSEGYQMLLSAVEYAVELMQEEQNVMLVTYDQKHVSVYDFAGEGTRYCLNLDEKPIRETISREIKNVKENLMKFLRVLPELYETPGASDKKYLARRGMEYSIQCLFKIGGKILHFSSFSMPPSAIHNGPKVRQEGFYSNTVYYDRIAKICNEHSISYSMFLFANIHSSVIEIADLCLQTRGSFKLYRKQDPAEQFYYHLIQTLIEQTVYNGTSRLRHSCSTIEKQNKTMLSNEWQFFPTSNPSKTQPGQLLNYNNLCPDTIVTMTINLRENIQDKYLVLQNSLLYVRPDGKTKLRISNWAIPLSSVLTQIHSSSNYEGLSVYFIRNELEMFIKGRGVVKTMEERIMSLCKQITFYKKHQWCEDVILLCLALLKNKIGMKQKGMMFSKKKLEEMWVGIIGVLDLNPAELLTLFVPQLFKVETDEEIVEESHQRGEQEQHQEYLPPLLPLVHTSIQKQSVYVMLCGRTIIVYYSQNYNGYRLYSESPNNKINSLIQKLSSLNNYKHYRVRQTGHNQFGDEHYQDFMNYLLYSEGLYELRVTHQQFLQLFG